MKNTIQRLHTAIKFINSLGVGEKDIYVTTIRRDHIVFQGCDNNGLVASLLKNKSLKHELIDSRFHSFTKNIGKSESYNDKFIVDITLS